MQAPTRSIALRALWAGVLVSFLAGPVFLWLAVAASEPPSDSEFPLRISEIGTLFYFSPATSIIGLAVSVPAAYVNAFVLIALAQRGIDGLVPAIVSASICGMVVPVFLLGLFGSSKQGLILGERAPIAVACLATTGALLGSVYWLIAVRPYRARLKSAASHP